MNHWMEMLMNSDQQGSASAESLIFSLTLAFTLGHAMGWVYMWTHDTLSYSKTFVASLTVLPTIVAFMMVMMATSIFVAFGLLAVFAVVRFRNVLKDTRDTVFVLWVIVEGMAVGTSHYSSAVVGMFFISIVLLYLRASEFGARRRLEAVLSLQLTGDLVAGLERLNSILQRHTIRTQLESERPLTNQGVSLSYHLMLRDPSRSDEMNWDLRQTEGIENISFYLRDEDCEV